MDMGPCYRHELLAVLRHSGRACQGLGVYDATPRSFPRTLGLLFTERLLGVGIAEGIHKVIPSTRGTCDDLTGDLWVFSQGWGWTCASAMVFSDWLSGKLGLSVISNSLTSGTMSPQGSVATTMSRLSSMCILLASGVSGRLNHTEREAMVVLRSLVGVVRQGSPAKMKKVYVYIT